MNAVISLAIVKIDAELFAIPLGSIKSIESIDRVRNTGEQGWIDLLGQDHLVMTLDHAPLQNRELVLVLNSDFNIALEVDSFISSELKQEDIWYVPPIMNANNSFVEALHYDRNADAVIYICAEHQLYQHLGAQADA